MIRFFSNNYSPEAVAMLRYLMSNSLAQLQKESECNGKSCTYCKYFAICSDIVSLTHYLDNLIKNSAGKGVK